MEEANALTYIGQDSYKSGYIAAKILMRNYQAGEGRSLVLFLSNKNSPAEITDATAFGRIYELYHRRV